MRNNGRLRRGFLAGIAFAAMACSNGVPSPGSPAALPPSAGIAGAASGASTDAVGLGPATPPFNLEAVLRGDGFGLVKFRQPKDGVAIVFLDTWLRDLKPDTSYRLQRAVDPLVDDVCSSQSWLTLGKGPTPQAIVTDQQGTGREELWRDLSTIPAGTAFDIHFQIVEDTTQIVVLRSGCYQFRVSP